jgi:hypothetical protein
VFQSFESIMVRATVSTLSSTVRCSSSCRLGGGKSSQTHDISTAKKLASEL